MSQTQIKLPKWAIVGIAALVLLGIGSAVYSSGWSQGFWMGLLTGNLEGGEMTPYLVSRTRGWHGGGFGFFGAIFRFFFFIFLFGLFFKFLAFWRWGMHGWHGGPGWRGGPGGPGGHGQPYPWQQQPHQAQSQPQQPSQSGDEPSQEPKGQPTSWINV